MSALAADPSGATRALGGGFFRYVGVGTARHPSLDTVRAFEAALGRAGVEHVPDASRAVRSVGKLLSRMGAIPSRAAPGERPYIVALMGRRSEYRLFPIALAAPIVVYAFDVWPPAYEWWTSFFRHHRISQAFFTASGAAARFASSGLDAVWLPEATDLDAFDPSRPLVERRIDVFEFGRRHPAIHKAIRVPLANARRSHVHQVVADRVVFPSRRAFVSALGDSRVAVCYPAADTNPEIAGGLEVMTQRYLEALASKCLIVGRAPADLVLLLGYDPVIALNPEAPADHLLAILDRIGEYQEHVDLGLHRLRQVGGWDDRVRRMLELLAAPSGAR